MNVSRPKFQSISLAVGLKWPGACGVRVEEKLDGVWHVREVAGAVLCGELMKDGRFFAFDIVRYYGQDARPLPLRERLALLDDLGKGELAGALLRPATGTGGEFLEAVLANGGEGIVIKNLDDPFGAPWTKCKRVETFDLRVIQKHPAGVASIELAELNGEPRGWCPCKAQFENVRVGDIVEIAAACVTARGKLREPRFIRVRRDKVK